MSSVHKGICLNEECRSNKNSNNKKWRDFILHRLKTLIDDFARVRRAFSTDKLEPNRMHNIVSYYIHIAMSNNLFESTWI